VTTGCDKSMNAAIEEIRRFWFGEEKDDARCAQAQQSLWWSKKPATDRRIAAKFGDDMAAACRGERVGWEGSAQGLLALIILVDQFRRNVFRSESRAFSRDSLARGWCRQLIADGTDRELRPIERVFAYLPLEHSEDIDDQQQSVELFDALCRQAPRHQQSVFESFLDYAKAHRDIIVRFGRFPHRNQVLERESTHEEAAFLEQPGSSF